MQLTGEEFVRASHSVETRHSGEQGGAAAPDTVVSNSYSNGHADDDRSAWVRIATAPNKPRRGSVASVLSAEPVTRTEREEIERIVHLGDQLPDVREGIVASLRERVEAGTYFINSETIAEMMLRRTLADRLR